MQTLAFSGASLGLGDGFVRGQHAIALEFTNVFGEFGNQDLVPNLYIVIVFLVTVEASISTLAFYAYEHAKIAPYRTVGHCCSSRNSGISPVPPVSESIRIPQKNRTFDILQLFQDGSQTACLLC